MYTQGSPACRSLPAACLLGWQCSCLSRNGLSFLCPVSNSDNNSSHYKGNILLIYHTEYQIQIFCHTEFVIIFVIVHLSVSYAHIDPLPLPSQPPILLIPPKNTHTHTHLHTHAQINKQPPPNTHTHTHHTHTHTHTHKERQI